MTKALAPVVPIGEVVEVIVRYDGTEYILGHGRVSTVTVDIPHAMGSYSSAYSRYVPPMERTISITLDTRETA